MQNVHTINASVTYNQVDYLASHIEIVSTIRNMQFETRCNERIKLQRYEIE